MNTTTTVVVSFFRNETDVRPRPQTLTIEELFELLTKHQPRTHKRRGMLWSPFLFNGARKGENLIESTLLAFDIDDGTSPEQVEEWLHGRSYFLASTHSSTPEHWKLRVGLALTEPIPAADFASVWHSAVAELLHGHVDPSTHDLARMFYLPTAPPGAEPYAEIAWGEPLDWRSLPRWEPPERPALPDLDGIEGLDAGVERRRAKPMLQKWCLDVANAPAGERHEAILRLGRAAGGLVGSGALAYDEVYAEFLDAAEACGEVADHGLRDVDRAIRSALQYGMDEPWTPAQLGDSDDWLTAPKAQIKGKTSSSRTSSAPKEKSGSTTGLLMAHSVRDERERAPEVVDWFIEGWLGRGMMTELVAKVKLGKTTFALQGLRACIAGDEAYCGQPILRACRVLYVTEEGRATFHEALQRYGLWGLDDEMMIVYDFEIIDIELKVAVGEMIRLAQEHQVDIVVIDTLTTVAGLDDEDNSGRVGAAMREFRRIANAGYAVWTLRHGRKIGGEVGDAGRGSSAISGAVDILLQLDPFKGDDDESNLRILRGRGRMKATPTDKLTLEFDKDTEIYRLVGQAVSREARLAASILNGLEELEAFDEARGKTSGEVTLKIGKRLDTVRKELKRMAEDGQVRDGTRQTSKGGTPAKIFWLPPVIRLHPDEPPPAPESAETVVIDVEPRAHTRAAPEGPTPESVTSSAPILSLRRTTIGTTGSGTTGQKRPKTPEAVAKAAAAKAQRELERLEAADAAAPMLDYRVVQYDSSMADAINRLSTVSVALDTETTGLNAKRDKLRTINLSDGQTHVVIDAWGITDWTLLQSYLDQVGTVSMHTYLFDLAFLQTVGLTVDPDKVYDVRTAAMVLESKEDWTDYRLQGIAKRHLAQHVSKAEQKKGWDAPVLRHAKLAYAAEDARVTHAAAIAVASKMARDADVDGLWSCLSLERDVQAATWWLASAGAPADVWVMQAAIAEQEETLEQTLATLNREAGIETVNWRSPKQVLPILVEHGLDVESTSEGALMDTVMGTEAPIPLVSALLSYRSASACLGLLRKAQSSIQEDGRIYASFNPIGAQTGRTSCSDPNLQNLPHETRAREAIRPVDGRIFVRADYSQLQLVIAAWIAQDDEMLKVLNDPHGDVHQRTADAVGCTRQQAKAVNFGFLFGAGAETFQREQRKNGVYLTEQQAWRYRETFMRTYRGIRSWHKSLSDWGTEETIYDPSGSGRRRAAVFSKNVKANTPVQMVEAHGFKRALQVLYNTRHEAPSARLVMMVHDELIAECDADDVARTQQWLCKGMLEPMQALLPGVVVRVDVKVTRSYADSDK
jgi:DNA polymerase-1